MLLHKVYYWLFNSQCKLCSQPNLHTDWHAHLQPAQSAFCLDCLADLPHLKHRCKICALPLQALFHTQPPNKDIPSHDDRVCKQCLKKPPSYAKVHAAFYYAFPIDRLISQVKYQRKPEHLPPLVSQLCLQLPNLDHIDAIIPIPMHPIDLLKRGFNQATLIAEHMSKHSQKPLLTRCLVKSKRSAHQAGLERQARMKNLKQVFSCNTAPPKRVLLVDDVMTTGATIESAAQTLLKAGVEHVEVAVIARTP